MGLGIVTNRVHHTEDNGQLNALLNALPLLNGPSYPYHQFFHEFAIGCLQLICRCVHLTSVPRCHAHIALRLSVFDYFISFHSPH